MTKLRILQLVTLMAVSGCSNSPIIVDRSTATFDGLYLTQSERFNQVFIRDPLDLSAYARVTTRSTASQYRHMPGESTSAQIAISTDQKVEFQQRLTELVSTELARGEHYTLVDETGPDVLTLWGTLVDVNAHNERDGTEVGEFILVFELRDSLSENTLVRVINPYRVAFAHNDPATNRENLDRVIGQLATNVREGLEQLMVTLR